MALFTSVFVNNFRACSNSPTKSMNWADMVADEEAKDMENKGFEFSTFIFLRCRKNDFFIELCIWATSFSISYS